VENKVRTTHIAIPPTAEGELLVIRVGDREQGIFPSIDDMQKIEQVISEALKKTPAVVCVPYYVKIKKIRLNSLKKKES
jgi:hypothetical protein